MSLKNMKQAKRYSIILTHEDKGQMRNFKFILTLILLLSSTLFLQACMNVATTGAEAAYNRHSLQNTFGDQHINFQIDHAIYWDSDRYKESNISIYTFNGVVLLTGQVPTKALHEELNRIIKNIPNVKEFYNETTVSPPSSSLTHVSDSWITTKIKSQLIATDEADPNQIKVVTENGTVYLMGIVLPDQAKIATEIAQSTSGVQNVVRIFSYIHITKN